jgi:Ser-tRNA(Ala) deacylase AlaX
MPTFANLPGATVEILDQGLRVSRPPSGPTILLLGITTSTNTKAAPYVPYSISDGSMTTAYQAFKNADGTVSELCQALYECHIAGGMDIELMNILPDASGALLTANDLYGYLGKAYEVIINHNVDIMVPVGVSLDDSVTANYHGGEGTSWNFGYQLANFCYQATKNNNTCIGVIAVNSATASPSGAPTLTELEDWVKDLETYAGALAPYDGTTATAVGVPGNYRFVATSTEEMPASYAGGDVVDAKGNKVDIGAYVSVVAANVRATNDAAIELYPTIGYYNTNGAAAYAGLVSGLESKSAPTNKIVQGVTLNQGVSENQANRLAGCRYVTFIQKPKGVVVASAMTGAYNIDQYSRSDFVRLSTVRIVHDAINYVRATADQFIGEPNNAPQRNAMATAIENALKNMQERGALRRFNFNVYATPTDQVLGKATVELILVPAFELQQIVVIVALTSE